MAAAVVLFAAALSTELYTVTSPPQFTFHVLLRKTYSIGAFALVAYLYQRSRAERGLTRSPLASILALALYSAAIEVGQFFVGSKEGIVWSAADVLCGALGGALAAWLPLPGMRSGGH